MDKKLAVAVIAKKTTDRKTTEAFEQPSSMDVLTPQTHYLDTKCRVPTTSNTFVIRCSAYA